MHISLTNWLVGATVHTNTLNAVNAAGCVAQYDGDPVAFDSASGKLGFALGASRRVRTYAFFDVRGAAHEVIFRLRSGGAAGTIVLSRNIILGASAVDTGEPTNYFDSAIFDVTADYAEIEMYNDDPPGQAQIGRIWVGDGYRATLCDVLSYAIHDTTTIEQSGTGEEFFTANRFRTEVSAPQLTLMDNLSGGASPTDGDYEDFIDALSYGSREAAVFCYDELRVIVFGRLEQMSIVRGAGASYHVRPFVVRGY